MSSLVKVNSNGNVNDKVNLVSLCKYLSKKLGKDYHLVTGVVYTNKGTIETIKSDTTDGVTHLHRVLSIVPLDVATCNIRMTIYNYDLYDADSDTDFEDLVPTYYDRDGNVINSHNICTMFVDDYEMANNQYYGYLNSGFVCIDYFRDLYGFDVPQNVIDDINNCN